MTFYFSYEQNNFNNYNAFLSFSINFLNISIIFKYIEIFKKIVFRLSNTSEIFRNKNKCNLNHILHTRYTILQLIKNQL